MQALPIVDRILNTMLKDDKRNDSAPLNARCTSKDRKTKLRTRPNAIKNTLIALQLIIKQNHFKKIDKMAANPCKSKQSYLAQP
jgi:hypothetical protein